MTQEIYCTHRDGAVLVSDSLLIRQHEDGRRERMAGRKLFALGRRAAIVSGGAAIGISLSLDLAQAAQAQGLDEIEQIMAFAPAFLDERYGIFLREWRPWYDAHPGAYQRLYFLIAGCPANQAPARAVLIGSERIDSPLRVFSVGPVVAMPRRLAAEVRLMKLSQSVSLTELAGECLRQLALLAQVDSGSVGGPFDGVMLTPAGLRPVIYDATTTSRGD